MPCFLVAWCYNLHIELNTIVYPAAYEGDTKTGVSMMISHTLSVITIPLMYLVFIELL